MIKRRYGIINKKGIFAVKTDTYMKNSYLVYLSNKSKEKIKTGVISFSNAYDQAWEYTHKLNGNIAIGLKNNKILCVWEMGNKDSTYKEFLI